MPKFIARTTIVVDNGKDPDDAKRTLKRVVKAREEFEVDKALGDTLVKRRKAWPIRSAEASEILAEQKAAEEAEEAQRKAEAQAAKGGKK